MVKKKRLGIYDVYLYRSGEIVARYEGKGGVIAYTRKGAYSIVKKDVSHHRWDAVRVRDTGEG